MCAANIEIRPLNARVLVLEIVVFTFIYVINVYVYM